MPEWALVSEITRFALMIPFQHNIYSITFSAHEIYKHIHFVHCDRVEGIFYNAIILQQHAYCTIIQIIQKHKSKYVTDKTKNNKKTTTIILKPSSNLQKV